MREFDRIAGVIGINIRARRREAGLSQQALGRYLGVTYQQIQKYESGTSALSGTKLVRLAALFRCSLDDLCQGALETVPAEIMPSTDVDEYRAAFLIRYFVRIKSRSVRDTLCHIVKAMAEPIASDG